MSGIVVVCDATHANIASLPPGPVAGYVTGSGDVPWTQADWEGHPGAIRIDQSPASSVWDATADVDDYETAAVGLSELAPRAKLRKAAFQAGTRPGQRSPLVYASASNISAVANALVNGGVSSGVGLWVANWNVTEPQAIAEVMAASGPFPIRGFQFHNAGAFDMSVFDAGWVNTVSAAPIAPVAHSGVQDGFRFCSTCSSLVHDTGPSVCPAGGTHAVRNSHNYLVSWNDLSG